ncbi:NAD(P)/FAD-dependent oxidoreductase [Aeromicrobium wangtongii]|uniref:NAD(P)/FAD-dependent oxidoreductase n=1 Tax=Aeromicrobium wangtongii TaxID=2969247 RepID=UPI00201790C9|nr:FAD-dependent oxidoreductase [Aeromicrobium wangtongii]MCL3817306.1 FAD-binding oxidoreductase [Aeromicrobium wangtongii]
MGQRSVIVVGAGMVGLSTAWHLQERGVDVTVIDRTGVAAGSSRGNAGWLSPALTLPLNDPSTLAAGVRATLKSDSPVYLPMRSAPRLAGFLSSFTRNSTPERWERSLRRLVQLSREALGAYAELADHDARLATREAAAVTAAFADERGREHLVDELEQLARIGEKVEYHLLDERSLHDSSPHLGPALTAGLAITGQRFIDPGQYVQRLADVVTERGGRIITGSAVVRVDATAGGAAVRLDSGRAEQASQVVLANGAWLSRLARPQGVRTRVVAGRGYSFSVPCPESLTAPLYLPEARVACTPLANGRLRVAGMMEFRSPDDPLDPRRIAAIERSASPHLPGIDWSDRQEEWVGSRPCTADGLPLLGRTRDQHVYVAGGHGMWGVALGPVSGRSMAELMCGERDEESLASFDPLR